MLNEYIKKFIVGTELIFQNLKKFTEVICI